MYSNQPQSISSSVCQEREVGDIETAINVLNSEIDVALDMFNTLRNRLIAVTRGDNVMGNSGHPAAVPSSPLSGVIREAADRVASLRMQIAKQIELTDL